MASTTHRFHHGVKWSGTFPEPAAEIFKPFRLFITNDLKPRTLLKIAKIDSKFIAIVKPNPTQKEAIFHIENNRKKSSARIILCAPEIKEINSRPIEKDKVTKKNQVEITPANKELLTQLMGRVCTANNMAGGLQFAMPIQRFTAEEYEQLINVESPAVAANIEIKPTETFGDVAIAKQPIPNYSRIIYSGEVLSPGEERKAVGSQHVIGVIGPDNNIIAYINGASPGFQNEAAMITDGPCPDEVSKLPLKEAAKPLVASANVFSTFGWVDGKGPITILQVVTPDGLPVPKGSPLLFSYGPLFWKAAGITRRFMTSTAEVVPLDQHIDVPPQEMLKEKTKNANPGNLKWHYIAKDDVACLKANDAKDNPAVLELARRFKSANKGLEKMIHVGVDGKTGINYIMILMTSNAIKILNAIPENVLENNAAALFAQSPAPAAPIAASSPAAPGLTG